MSSSRIKTIIFIATVCGLVVCIDPFVQKAEATQLVWKRVGEWIQTIYNPFTGNPIFDITVPHFRLEEIKLQFPSLALTDIDLGQGSLADAFLTNLGGGVHPVTATGDDIAFDNTVLPDKPGFTTSTNGGTGWNLIFTNPIANPGIDVPIDVSSLGIELATPLDLANPTLVTCAVSTSSGLSSAECSVVPEPSTYFLFVTGLIGLLGYGWLRKKTTQV